MSRSLQSPSTIEVKAEGTTTVKYDEENVMKRTGEDGEDIKEIGLAEENDDSDGKNDFALPAEELIKRADDFIARHLAYEYAKRGALLALIARRENALQEVANQAREYGSPDVLIISADVSKVEDGKRIVNETMSHFGRLDHLVKNAGIASACLFEDATDITDFKTVMDINFWGSVYTTHLALPHLRESRGKMIVLASSSWLPTPRMSFYNASSAAIVSFFETLRVEVGPEIKITIVTPEFIESEMTPGSKFLSSTIPARTVRGCAKAIVNSACKGERYMTEPAWFRVTYFWKVFFPKVIEWSYQLMYINRLGTSHKEAPSKKILDLLGAKNIIYPSIIDNPEIKTD
ncbi:11-beta-hydroxysteroid dehydrogenase A [Quercus suber]|uniref:11-beta-hydroxysteroid dehydrogenase A n=1 Tax=Quercus suber TaxID=58331 RepID=UPI0032E042E4